MRISITPRAALVALLGLPVLVLWPAWWTVLLVLLAWLLVVLGDAFLAPSPRQLTVHRDAPGQVRLGGEAGGRLLVTNRRNVLRTSRSVTPGTPPLGSTTSGPSCGYRPGSGAP